MKKEAISETLVSLNKNTHRKTLALSAAIAATSVGATVPALAQSVLLEEIIVTAQKREQNLQDVGIAVTAFSGDQIKELGYTNSIDIAQQTPGLNIIQFHPTLTTVSIRGVSQNDFADHLEPPIALVVDNVYVSSMGAAHAQLFDTARVETLRGPQGTLFGRNATGGLIHYVSEAPTEEFEGYATTTIGNYGTRKFEGALSGSLTENLQARLSIATDNNDGLLENRAGRDKRDTDARALRLQLAWQPTNGLDILWKLQTAKDDAGGNSYVHNTTTLNAFGLGEKIPSNVDFYGTGPGADFNGYTDFDGDPHKGDYDEPGFFKREINGSTLQVTYDLSEGMSLTSVTDYMVMKKDYREDTDGSPFPYFLFQTGQDFKQYSQELRLNGETESLRWQTGLYYLNIESDSSAVFDLDLHPFSIFDTGDPATDIGTTDFGQVINIGGHNSLLESESWAVFGQTDFDLSDALTVTLGLRYTDDTRDVDYNGFDNFGAGNVESDSAGYDNFSYKAQLDWRPNEETLVYAGITQGHKAGNFRLGIGDPNLLVEHDQEELLSYEVGIKTDLLDGAMRFNASAFYYDYTDYQAFVTDSSTGTIATLSIVNVDATAKGMELELIASPLEGLDLLLGATWMESEVPDVTLPDGVTVIDSELPYAPSYSLNGLVRYQWDLFDGVASAQLDFNYSDDFCFSVFCAPLDEEEAYVVANARVKYEFPGEQWSISGFVTNFTDREYRLYTLDVSSLGIANDAFAAPKMYGVTVDVKF